MMNDFLYWSGVFYWFLMFVGVLIFVWRISPKRLKVFITDLLTILHPVIFSDPEGQKLKMVNYKIENNKWPEQRFFGKWWRFWLRIKNKNIHDEK